jgi:hypothetical protein
MKMMLFYDREARQVEEQRKKEEMELKELTALEETRRRVRSEAAELVLQAKVSGDSFIGLRLSFTWNTDASFLSLNSSEFTVD